MSMKKVTTNIHFRPSIQISSFLHIWINKVIYDFYSFYRLNNNFYIKIINRKNSKVHVWIYIKSKPKLNKTWSYKNLSLCQICVIFLFHSLSEVEKLNVIKLTTCGECRPVKCNITWMHHPISENFVYDF